jgi:hypothetical protein
MNDDIKVTNNLIQVFRLPNEKVKDIAIKDGRNLYSLDAVVEFTSGQIQHFRYSKLSFVDLAHKIADYNEHYLKGFTIRSYSSKYSKRFSYDRYDGYYSNDPAFLHKFSSLLDDKEKYKYRIVTFGIKDGLQTDLIYQCLPSADKVSEELIKLREGFEVYYNEEEIISKEKSDENYEGFTFKTDCSDEAVRAAGMIVNEHPDLFHSIDSSFLKRLYETDFRFCYTPRILTVLKVLANLKYEFVETMIHKVLTSRNTTRHDFQICKNALVINDKYLQHLGFEVEKLITKNRRTPFKKLPVYQFSDIWNLVQAFDLCCEGLQKYLFTEEITVKEAIELMKLLVTLKVKTDKPMTIWQLRSLASLKKRH